MGGYLVHMIRQPPEIKIIYHIIILSYDKESDQWHVSVPKKGESESGRRSVGKVKLA